MRVLQINATWGVGSTGLIMRDIGQALTSAGGEAYFAYQTAAEPPANGYRVGNTPDHKRHALLCRVFGGQGFYSRHATKNLCRYIDQISPDVVHLHNLHSNYVHLTRLLAHLARRDIPTVITMHDCWFFTGKCFHYVDVGCDKFKRDCGNCPKKSEAPASAIFDRSRRDLNRKIKALSGIPRLYLVGCSDWVCDEARQSRLSACDIRRIYNGVDTSVFTPRDDAKTKAEYGLDGKQIIMGMANKWFKKANRPLLQKMTDSLPEDRVLVIVGCNDRQRQELAAYGDRVRAVGFIRDRDELARVYSMADVFVNPTHADTLPTVNMESICSGTPVITYDVGGGPELVDENTGVIVPEWDISAIMQAVEDVLSRDMPVCSDAVRDRFDKTKCYAKYVELYRTICGDTDTNTNNEESITMNGYTPDEQLVKLQEKMLEILKEVIRLCEKHDLRYALAYGTLLGAVRHHGYIPWDDDVDIVMPRGDFEKFKAIAVTELSEPYFFQDYSTDDEYPSCVAKVRDSSTTLVENGYRNLKRMNHGIWVDIFVADCYKPGRRARMHQTLARVFRRLLLERAAPSKGLMGGICRLLPRRWMFGQHERHLKKMGKGTEDTCLVYNDIFPTDTLTDTVMMDFEGIQARVPREYDRLLTSLYGDYMELPPESDRVPRHMTEIMSVDTSYREFFQENV